MPSIIERPVERRVADRKLGGMCELALHLRAGGEVRRITRLHRIVCHKIKPENVLDKHAVSVAAMCGTVQEIRVVLSCRWRYRSM